MFVINPEIFRLGPISIRWYAVLILSGAVLATILSNRLAKSKGFPEEFITDLLFYVLPIGILGARLYYVVFKWEDYQHNLLSVFKIWEGGLAIYGGLLAGLGVIFWYSKKYKANPIVLVDMIVPYVLLAQGIGRWGNFINQEAFGDVVTRGYLENLHLPTFIIDQMNINGSYYQPTFLYESVLSFLGFILMIVLRNRIKSLRIGDLTLMYMFWYGIERFVVEGMRSDSLYIGTIRVSQALSLILVVMAIVVYFYKKRFIKETFAEYVYHK